MKFILWIKKQGFAPEWLIGKRIRIIKLCPIVEDEYYVLIDNVVMEKISDNKIEFTNGDIFLLPEDSNLIMDFNIQVYREPIKI